MKKYIVNPNYILRPEEHKTYVMADPNGRAQSLISVIHPVYAMMLSFFNNTDFDEAVSQISSFFSVSEDKVKLQLSTLIENSDYVTNGSSVFPKNMIVEFDESMSLHNYKPEQFIYSNPDIRISRLESPSDIICNVTLRCHTSCFYCYADRKGNGNKSMPIELLEKIIDEAKRIGVYRFQLMGGEVLLYKDWERALRKLAKCGYQPHMSTKLPLTEEHIAIYKELNFNSPIQISLDTLIKEHLYDILNVKDPYYDQIIHAFDLLEKYQIKYIVNTVINHRNASLEDIKSLVDFLHGRKYLVKWGMNSAKCSMYIGVPYDTYKAPKDKVIEIEQYILDLKRQNYFDFEVLEPSPTRDVNSYTREEKERIWKKRNLCSGNLNALYILPDGKVTICEELYWHPRFILGDLHAQTLEEIWNSPKAKDLFFIKQSDIQDASPCKTCEDFVDCKEFLHVCWRNVVLAYGKENWDFPGIFCPKAP